MRWQDIDFENQIARVERTKNGDTRVLPLTPRVIEELRRFEGAPSALVFPSARRPAVPYNFQTAWKTALTAAKIKRFRFHDLRHSAASYLAQANTPLLTIAEILGHRNLATTRRYSHLAVGHKATVVNAVLGDIGGDE